MSCKTVSMPSPFGLFFAVGEFIYFLLLFVDGDHGDVSQKWRTPPFALKLIEVPGLLPHQPSPWPSLLLDSHHAIRLQFDRPERPGKPPGTESSRPGVVPVSSFSLEVTSAQGWGPVREFS